MITQLLRKFHCFFVCGVKVQPKFLLRRMAICRWLLKFACIYTEKNLRLTYSFDTSQAR